MKFELGEVLEDKVTGFNGVALGVTTYHTGCIHYGLCSQRLKDGKPIDWEWFDEARLESTKHIIDVKTEETKGGPFPNASQM